MSQLYFFRHAQASFGAKNYDQLSEKGIDQSRILGKYLLENDFHFDKVYSGPLSRQMNTARLVQEVYTENDKIFPSPTLVTGLKEHDATEASKIALPQLIENVPYIKNLIDELSNHPEKARRNGLLVFKYFMEEWSEGKIKVPVVETWANFRKASKEALDIILDNTDKGEKIAVFTSGGTISSIIAEAIQIKHERNIAQLNFSIRNTSFSTFLYSNKEFNLLSMNEIPHLDKQMITFV